MSSVRMKGGGDPVSGRRRLDVEKKDVDIKIGVASRDVGDKVIFEVPKDQILLWNKGLIVIQIFPDD